MLRISHCGRNRVSHGLRPAASAASSADPGRLVDALSGSGGGPKGGRVERWRGGLGSAYLFSALSSASASLAARCSVSTLPLITPDVQIFGIRLSDKDSCFRPRNVEVAQEESDKTQRSVDVFVGITRDRLSRHNLVLPTQPPTEPVAGMSGYHPIRFAHRTLAEIVRPSNHDTVALCYLFFSVPPA